jgi:predicted RNase H-like HicB family nuclease
LSGDVSYAYIINGAEDGSDSANVPDRPGCTICGQTILEAC